MRGRLDSPYSGSVQLYMIVSSQNSKRQLAPRIGAGQVVMKIFSIRILPK